MPLRGLNDLFPEFAEYLRQQPLDKLETPESDAIATFKSMGVTGLTVPAERNGSGASARETVRVQREIGALAPSLAVGTTMHHFSAATLVEFASTAPEDQQELVDALFAANTLIASGFAEGRPGGSLFRPNMTAERRGDNYYISGTKKPCSLSASMDLLMVSLSAEAEDGTSTRGIGLIPGGTEGIVRHRFWTSPILAGAESDEVELTNVEVPSDLVILDTPDSDTRAQEMTALLRFGMLITASYLGTLDALTTLLKEKPKRDMGELLNLSAEAETLGAALDAVGARFDAGERGGDLSASLLLIRHGARGAFSRASTAALNGLGGMQFIQNPTVSYLTSVLQAYRFHPPTTKEVGESVGHFLDTGEFAFIA